ncbi:MAG TPA: DNA translocase FtsK 4TM domain-containing protein [Limnochordia bacterium]|nr:DNA translocase FtsK 4TM domain-containing protein [Limnochordia bacterium]
MKGKIKAQKNNSARAREVGGILLLAFSVFCLLSLYLDSTGWVGSPVRAILRMCFGDLAPLFAILFGAAAVQLFLGRNRPLSWQSQLGLLLLLFSVTLIFHMLYYRGYQFPPSLREEIAYGLKGEGAGVLGAVLLTLSYTAFGVHGSYVLVATAIILGIILFFGISITDLLRRLFSALAGLVRRWWRAGLNGQGQQKEKRRAKGQRRAKPQEVPSEPVVAAVEPAAEAAPQVGKAKPKRSAAQAEPEQQQEKPVEELVLNLPTSDGKGMYRLPPTHLLLKASSKSRRNVNLQQDLLEETLANFGIEAKVVNVSQGPVVTRYELQPAPGIKVSRITALADDLALALAAQDVRIEAPVPGKPVVGIEVPNKETEPVLLRDVLESPEFAEHPSPVALALGKDIAGQPVIADLKKWLHVLIAGATGSGKSVCLNCIISSLLFRTTPDLVKLLLVDPKRVELSVYDGIPHLISPVVTDPKKAAIALRWAVGEMERRYELFAEVGVRNIEMYHEWAQEAPEGEEREHLPYIVIVVDELADLMMVAAAEVEDAICRLAQMARAAGMYLIIATQRPSVDVITGLIKANVPSRISFAVSSQVDSRTILDMGGAERLIGKGDMLYYPIGASKPIRAQGAWISDKEVEAVVKYWKEQGEPEYQEDVVEDVPDFNLRDEEEDELLEDAIRLVVENGQASISMLQRRFRIGYSRAARLIDMMEVRGIVGGYQGSKPREVLVDKAVLEER